MTSSDMYLLMAHTQCVRVKFCKQTASQLVRVSFASWVLNSASVVDCLISSWIVFQILSPIYLTFLLQAVRFTLGILSSQFSASLVLQARVFRVYSYIFAQTVGGRSVSDYKPEWQYACTYVGPGNSSGV